MKTVMWFWVHDIPLSLELKLKVKNYEKKTLALATDQSLHV